MSTDRPTKYAESETALLAKVIAFALAIRWTYCLVLFAFMGNDGITGVDSESLLSHGQNFAKSLADGAVHGWQWVGTDPLVMPLFTWVIAIYIFIFGKWAVLSYVMSQGILDSATCYLIYRIARTFDSGSAIPAAIASAVNPTQIVLSGFFYTDTPFVFFVALFLLASVQWLTSPTWRTAMLIGLGLGGGMLFRPVIAPWVPAFAAFLLVSAAIRRDLSAHRLGQVATVIIIISICTVPILMQNVTQYGAWALTSQSGMHLSRWIAPLVREAKDGTPWVVGYKETERRTAERFGKESPNPFEQSRRYREIALEELGRLGPVAITKAWLIGAAINLAAPAIILSPPISHLPRTGFYATHGRTMMEKIKKFLFSSDSALYAWVLLVGIAGVAIARMLEFIGVVELIRVDANRWILLLFAGWCLYILVANGPIASPKYRLPIEPVLMVLTGVGAKALIQRGKNPPRA
jgi:hypothetical protein